MNLDPEWNHYRPDLPDEKLEEIIQSYKGKPAMPSWVGHELIRRREKEMSIHCHRQWPHQWDEALDVINLLAPVTRRDDWWGTDGPREIIFEALCKTIEGLRARGSPR